MLNLEMFFPKLRRGHSMGTRLDKKYGRKRCTSETCSSNNPKSKDHHLDRKANIKDWEAERGIKLESFYNRAAKPWLFGQPQRA
jgi:hypothetical protein